ncbi:hypothetical protein TVAG_505310 [Trichomonas vaginalis G3]|uniref:Uncharacterized protein n=1 Tax=Trichomonas vaginalis (strain ATCC PRA-98 / G3) TaxID=412133 RepID=A2H7M4_TRIV3|nr:hypothetical protein TVAGG3_0371640 [Trichomonas vaginalis G3]EAX74593.1 hypothetical protein TVAG_505310 [Trichomonas vaginalis G3]KAI5532636.1 hypothetical protein TVAGG3_0371640 [Trichomonas vaginalis G3]|eukprot:XP_001287523.1 hypothetical protein [Trichomonas vaginalis G3]
MTAWDPHVYDEWIPFKKTKYPPTPEKLETKCGKKCFTTISYYENEPNQSDKGRLFTYCAECSETLVQGQFVRCIKKAGKMILKIISANFYSQCPTTFLLSTKLRILSKQLALVMILR